MVILILGLFVAVTVNADSIRIAKQLSTDRSLRESLKLYTQLGKCLDGEIQFFTERQKAVANSEAAPQVEQELRKLTRMKSSVAGHITILRTLLDSTGEVAGGDTRGPTITEKRSTVPTKGPMRAPAPAREATAMASGESLSTASTAPTRRITRVQEY